MYCEIVPEVVCGDIWVVCGSLWWFAVFQWIRLIPPKYEQTK